MKKVLVLVSGYLPGYKSGGPVRTIENLINALSNVFSFCVLCSDRDLGDKSAYESVQPGVWNKVGEANVLYIPPGVLGYWRLISVLRKKDYDILYLNSFFAFKYSIFPILMVFLFNIKIPLLLGPKGEFSENALQLKRNKKRLFLLFSKFFGIHKNVTWHASSIYEEIDIRRTIGELVSVRNGIDIAAKKEVFEVGERLLGAPLKLIFISRISRKKNLIGALQILSNVRVPIIFDIYGPIEDVEYWSDCLRAAGNLPENIKYSYQGVLLPENVGVTLCRYDVFFFPTLGENFGHVIAEALFAGLPVLISNTTPWCNLEKEGVGWDVPLESMEIFVNCIELCYERSPAEFSDWHLKIQAWAAKNIGNEEAIKQNVELFNI